MGLDYSINLYFPVDRIEQALTATAAIASPRPRQTESPLTVYLPSGRMLKLPFTLSFKTEPVSLAAGGKAVIFDTVLMFPLDARIEEFFAKDNSDIPTQTRAGQVCTEIGYLYLYVHIGSRFAEFSFTAATSSMSRLLLSSPSMHAVFQRLLTEAGGLTGLIDVERNTFPLLSNPALDITFTDEELDWIDFETWKVRIPEFDRYVELILEKVRSVTA